MHRAINLTLLVAFYVLTFCLPACTSTKTVKPGPSEYIRPIRAIEFAGIEKVVLATGYGDLRISSDGGTSWTTTTPEFIKQIRDLSFVETEIGWAVTDSGNVWQTTNGGADWEMISSIPLNLEPKGGLIQEFDFVSRFDGWAIDLSSVWRTNDGGFTWNRYRVSPPGYSSLLSYCWFNTNRDGWALSQEGFVYFTSDGGQSWRSGNALANRKPYRVFFSSSLRGWALSTSDEPSLLELSSTDNGGASWQSRHMFSPEQNIVNVWFLDNAHGWVLGNQRLDPFAPISKLQGLALFTSDGGLTWESSAPKDGSYNYKRVYFTDLKHGWLVSLNDLFRTNDSGKTWQRVLSLPLEEWQKPFQSR